MSKNSFIDKVSIGSPCSQDWNKMRGNDHVRMCDHCVKEVNNLSEFTRKDAKHLIRTKGKNICIRYIQDPVTKRPLFADQLHQITRRAPGITAGVMTASLSLSTLTYAQNSSSAAAQSTVPPENIAINGPRQQDSVSTAAETTTGKASISGTVTDSNGAVIPGAEVTAVESTTKDISSVRTDADGKYQIGSLEAGTYTINVSASGFKTTVVQNVNAANDLDQSIQTTLEISSDSVVVGDIAFVAYENELSQAVDDDDLDRVRDLISKGGNVNEKDENYGKITPLFIAVENGNIEMVQLLLNFGAKVNTRSQSRQTPLMQLDGDATAEIVNTLVGRGAKLNVSDEDGNTALILAAENASTDVIRALIDAGADVSLANKEGVTALMNAADRGNIETVRLLLNAGANVNAKDKEGDNAWEYADDPEIEQLLISYGSEFRPEAASKSEVDQTVNL